MEVSAVPSFSKNSKSLARNRPIALIAGASGFIGSHLVDHFLKLKVQVIGIDDLSRGKREYLVSSLKDDNFQFHNCKIEDVEVSDVVNNLPRLDYAFFVASNSSSKTLLKFGLENFLLISNEFHKVQLTSNEPQANKPKILFLSSIELYDNQLESSLKMLSDGEILFAKFSGDHSLNSRVVRLGEVYGPRMPLGQSGILTRLIKASLSNNLSHESPIQDFSVRGIYIDDAISLLAKSILLGASSNKIFDGIRLNPLKVEEIKQVLLDPKWYEKEGFNFTSLPPWETPNLNRSLKELSWKPKNNIVSGLSETLQFFWNNPDFLKNLDYFEEKKILEQVFVEDPILEVINTEKVLVGDPAETKDENEKIEISQQIKKKNNKAGDWSFRDIEKPKEEYQVKKIAIWPIFNFLVIWVIILVGLVYPVFVFTAGKIVIPNSLKKAKSEVVTGDYSLTQKEIGFGYLNSKEQDNLISSLATLKFLGKFGDNIGVIKQLSNQSVESFLATQQIVNTLDKFVDDLEKGNVNTEKFSQYLITEKENQQILADSLAKFSDLPNVPIGIVDKASLKDFYNISIQTQIGLQFLPNLLGQETEKNYLVILQDNRVLTPTGGKLMALLKLKTLKGRVVDVSPISINEVDSQLPSTLVPEDLVKSTLNLNQLKLSGSSFDSDFPTFGRVFETLYSQAGKQQVDGIFAIDLVGAQQLLIAEKGIVLGNSKKISSSEDLTNTVNNGNEGEISELFKQLVTKLFTINRQNLFKLATVIGTNLDQKHILVFVNDNQLQTNILFKNWGGKMGFLQTNQDSIQDFVSTEIYSFNSSSDLTKQFDDKLEIKDQGVIQHTLTTNFVQHGDKSFSGELFFYLPLGVKVLKVDLAGSDVTDKIQQFIKYGVSGLALSLDVKEGGSKRIAVTYQLGTSLKKEKGNVNYHYIFLKQPGTMADDLSWSVNVSTGMETYDNLNNGKKVENTEVIRTNLEMDKQIDLTFKNTNL